MTEQEIDLRDPRVLHRAAEHLVQRYAGVFFPELVERCLIDCYTELTRQARVQSYLMPMALHDAGDRLTALARDKTNGPGRGRMCQVLFVDDHDTGPAAVAATLLAAHAGEAVVTCSAGIAPGAALDPFAVQVLAQHGVDPAAVVRQPLSAALLSAADWVIILGAQDVGPVGAGTSYQHWPVDSTLDPERNPGAVAELQIRAQTLWLEITADTAVGTGFGPTQEQA
ncbi:hypothetical protein GCM10009696_36950 [Kocuria himachalensis]